MLHTSHDFSIFWVSDGNFFFFDCSDRQTPKYKTIYFNVDETKSEKLIFNYCVTGINYKHELSGLITKLLKQTVS
jgi:hypothetical protein